VIEMLQDRVETETTYAMRLERISNSYRTSLNDRIQNSSISEEIACFKAACGARAVQALEIANNVTSDCIQPLKNLVKE
jgi:hypothetical protein